MASIVVYPLVSPRIIEVLAPATEVTVQELVDLVRDWEDDESNMSYEPLLDAAGKEPLGGGIMVGITATLQNAKVMFSARAEHLADGICGANDPDGTTLIDIYGNFITNGVSSGDTIHNHSTGGEAAVISVISEQELHSFPLIGGSRSTWLIGDEYGVHKNVQCNISGGNLVAVDENDNEMSCVLPSPNVQIIRTASSSATLQELTSIQYSSFNGGVTIDTSSSHSGTAFPVGTPQQPVNNTTDAHLIATERGLTTFFVKGALTLGAGDDFSDHIIVGESISKTILVIDPDASVSGCEIRSCKVSGTLDGDSTINGCLVENLLYVEGTIQSSIISGTVTLNGDEAIFLDCWSGLPDMVDIPTINMNNGTTNLNVKGHSGYIRVINNTQPTLMHLDIQSGAVMLASSVTAGSITIRGVGQLINESGGTATVDSDGLMAKQTIASAVHEEIGGEIQYAAFRGKVWLDVDNGTSGTTYPIGTPMSPVDNIEDAMIIAADRGFDTIHLLSNLTVTYGQVIDEFTFISNNWLEIHIEENVSTVNTVFEKLSVYGVMGGYWNVLIDCWVFDITNLCGWLRGGSFEYIELAPYTPESAGQTFIDSPIPMYPGVPSVLVMNTDTVVSFTNAIDIYQINGMTDGCLVDFDLRGGKVSVDASCTGGDLVMFGTGTIEDNSGGAATINIDGFMNNELVADHAWDETLADHLFPGTTGEKLSTGGSGDPETIAAAVWDAQREDHDEEGSFGAVSEWAGEVNVDAIADAVWDETMADHLAPGTTGEKLSTGGTGDPSAIADAVWDEPADEHVEDGTMGELENKLGNLNIAKPKVIPGD